jgi:hypothetical protein
MIQAQERGTDAVIPGLSDYRISPIIQISIFLGTATVYSNPEPNSIKVMIAHVEQSLPTSMFYENN